MTEDFKPISRKHTLDENPVLTFGKYKGSHVEEVPATYLLWCWDEMENLSATYPAVYAYIKKNREELRIDAELESSYDPKDLFDPY